MGKPKSLSNCNKMAEIIAERRKAGDPLKRSKSVRASLRFIGNKFLHHKSNNESMTKVKSLSNLTEFKQKRDFKRSISHDESRNIIFSLPDDYVKEPVKINSKTTVGEIGKSVGAKLKNKFKITTPPPVIAPKAAQILQIPIQENLEPVSLQSEHFIYNNTVSAKHQEYDVESQYTNYEYRRNVFQRNTFRLSLAPSKKKILRNSAAMQYPSKYLFKRRINDFHKYINI